MASYEAYNLKMNNNGTFFEQFNSIDKRFFHFMRLYKHNSNSISSPLKTNFMFFTSTQRYLASIPKEDLKNRLIGNHVKIHNMDFEVYEKDHSLRIIPHAEQTEGIKTLPITRVEMNEEGSKMNVVVTSKMRKLDSGGPILIMFFCIFMILASVILMAVDGEPKMTYSLLAIGSSILIVFFVRMQMGYFDYIRKIRSYVKSQIEFA